MKTDIEIAQEAKMLHIREVAEKLGITEDFPIHSAVCKRVGARCMSLQRSAMSVTENVSKCAGKNVNSGSSSVEWTERLRELLSIPN